MGSTASPSSWAPPVPWWGVAFLIVGTIAIYLNSLPNALQIDDRDLIVENPSVYPSASLVDHFRSATAGRADLPTRSYRPLLMVTYSLNYWWGGTDPIGYHAVNIGLHVLCTLLVAVLLWHLSANRLAATLGAILFAVHPIQTEAVNYISARSSILYTLWSLLTVILFIRFRDAGGLSLYLAALVSFAAALLSKEAAIVVPLLLVAYDVYFRGTDLRKLKPWIAPHLGFLSVSVAFLLARWVAMGAVGPKAITHHIPTVLLTYAVVVMKTLQGQLLPLHLSAFHPMDFEPSLRDPSVLASCAVLLAMIGLSLVLHRRFPLMSLGLLWFPVGLLPIAALAFITELTLYQENRGYFSSVGLILLFSPMLAACWNAVSTRARLATRLIMVGLVVTMGATVLKRNLAWRDPVTLWTHVAEVYPDDPSSLLILARAHRIHGNRQSAITVLEQATARLPPNAILYNELCALYVDEGAFDQAIRPCLAAIRRGPKLPNPYFNLGTAYSMTGRPKLAVEAYEQFLRLAETEPKLSFLAQRAQSRLDALRLNPASD